MITLNEAIELTKQHNKCQFEESKECASIEFCTDCDKYYDGKEWDEFCKQLPVLLEELKEYKKRTFNYTEMLDARYEQGRADAINAIKNDLYDRLSEEMNNPHQDQGLCQGLHYVIQRCDWFLSDDKERKND